MLFKTISHVLKIQLFLLHSLNHSEATDFFTYNDEYDEENYEYEENSSEQEQAAAFLPVFTSSPTVYTIKEGHTARLECSVDRLGPMVLSWKRIINDTSHYVATGQLIMVSNKRMSLLTSTASSTLLITLVKEEDAGQYVCEVSSSPPVHMAHWIKIRAPPKVSILGKPSSGLFQVMENSELALICSAEGEPEPVVSWTRQGSDLPDGSSSFPGDQLIFSHVTRDHAGTYVCTGSTSEGRMAIDTVDVLVNYGPLMTGWHSYTHNKQNTSLELICSVTSYPRAKVTWQRHGSGSSLDNVKVDVHDDKNVADRVRHVLTIDHPTREDVQGVFVCRAENTAGSSEKIINVKGDSDNNSDMGRVKKDKFEVVEKKEDSGETDDHKLLIAIAYKVNKLETENEAIVQGLKQNKRYLHSILRHMKQLLSKDEV